MGMAGGNFGERGVEDSVYSPNGGNRLVVGSSPPSWRRGASSTAYGRGIESDDAVEMQRFGGRYQQQPPARASIAPSQHGQQPPLLLPEEEEEESSVVGNLSGWGHNFAPGTAGGTARGW